MRRDPWGEDLEADVWDRVDDAYDRVRDERLEALDYERRDEA